MSYPLTDNSVIINIIEEPTEKTKIIDLYKTYNTHNSNTHNSKLQSCCEYEIDCKYCNVPIYCLNLIIFVSIIIIMLISKYS